MTIITLAAIYFIVWWVVLFAVLPWGVRSQEESGTVETGTDPGAPVVPYLMAKVIWTTIVAAVVFGIGYAAFSMHVVSFDGVLKLLGVPTSL